MTPAGSLAKHLSVSHGLKSACMKFRETIQMQTTFLEARAVTGFTEIVPADRTQMRESTLGEGRGGDLMPPTRRSRKKR